MTFFPYTIKILTALGFAVPAVANYTPPVESQLPAVSFNGVPRGDGACAVVVATQSGKVAAASTFKSSGVTIYDFDGDDEDIKPVVVPFFPYSVFATIPQRREVVFTFTDQVTVTHSTWEDFGQATATLNQPKWAVSTAYTCDPHTCACSK
jgi:hypothetical protein